MRILTVMPFVMAWSINFCFGQFRQYDSLAISAYHLFKQNDFQKSVSEYSKAFSIPGVKGFPEDRYNAAIAWTLIDVYDSVFANLFHLAEHTCFLESHGLFPYTPQFKRLHSDLRWAELLARIEFRKEAYNVSLATVLSIIYEDDQKYRLQHDSVMKKFGRDSKEYRDLHSTRELHDSLNLNKIIQILEIYGWLSANEVGTDGNTAIWLVIQHAPLSLQEKYFPVMREAVERGNASLKHLAYLQDRILVRQSKKQLFATQSRRDFKTNTSVLEEVEDPQNLNKRREWVGLQPMGKD